MNYSKQTLTFANDLVFHYAKFDIFSQGYIINLSDIPYFDLHSFSVLLIQDDKSRAAEATGPDNPAYEKIMLPALVGFMKDTTNKDNETEFNKAWSDGITSYFSNSMQEILNKCASHR